MAADPTLTAELTLGRARGRVGVDRVALLAAVRDTGSISAAARTVGLSYKAAWDAVQVMNNLFERPLIEAAPGGKVGGGAQVTAAGTLVLETYAAAEAAWAAVAQRLAAGVASTNPSSILWSIGMKTSARNALRGTVTHIKPGAVNSEVTLEIAPGVEMVATVTRTSVDTLELAGGTPAIALVKSSFVVLAPGSEPLRTSARNCLAGTVATREDGPVSSEITLDLAAGKTLTATLTRESADHLDLTPGTPALALIKASHVILAVE
jgi:molybdate transport system regulatory protein